MWLIVSSQYEGRGRAATTDIGFAWVAFKPRKDIDNNLLFDGRFQINVDTPPTELLESIANPVKSAVISDEF
jgi:hypothetical protein